MCATTLGDDEHPEVQREEELRGVGEPGVGRRAARPPQPG